MVVVRINSHGFLLIAAGYTGATVMFLLQTTEPRSPSRPPVQEQLILGPVILAESKGHLLK